MCLHFICYISYVLPFIKFIMRDIINTTLYICMLHITLDIQGEEKIWKKYGTLKNFEKINKHKFYRRMF